MGSAAAATATPTSVAKPGPVREAASDGLLALAITLPPAVLGSNGQELEVDRHEALLTALKEALPGAQRDTELF